MGMHNLIKRVRAWFTSVLSVEILLREQKLLLFAMLFYFCATGVCGVYVNLFIYRTTVNLASMAATNALTNVIVFNLLTCIFSIAISAFLGLFGKRLSEKNGMLSGLFIYIALFVILLVAEVKVLKYLWLIALLCASGGALFHISYNQILSVTFGERTKRLFISIVSAFIGIAGILTPLIAGIFVQNGKNMNGYTVAFGTALVMLAVSVGFVLYVRLPKKRISKRTYFAGVLLQAMQDRNLRLVHIAELLRGIREGALVFLFPVLIYTLSENAVLVGLYVAICAAVQMLGERHVARTQTPENRMGLMLFAVAVIVVATIVFAFGFNVMAIYAYGIITALISGFMNLPIVGLFHWSIGAISNVNKKALEIQQVRELFIGMGKLLGCLLLWAFYKINMLAVAVILVNFVLVLVWVLFSRVGEEAQNQEIIVRTETEVLEDMKDAD